MGTSGLLGGLEEMVLLAVAQLGDETYAVPVRGLLEERLERSISMGAVYTTLDRLDEKGLTDSETREGDATRQGRPRRYFRILPAGIAALRQTAELRARMWASVGNLK